MADKPASMRHTARALGALCDVSERTVRFYVEEGLLPPPRGRGRGANFDDDHLVRLKLIRAMQQAGNELGAIGEYLRELEREVKGKASGFEAALAIWSGRNEQAVWREELRKRWGGAQHVLRFRIAQGVELLIDTERMPEQGRMQELLSTLRQAFEDDEDDG
jgi:DNA-binding transcriptional MerR regulator